ncbi:hypothetical protein [Microbacterium sp. zg-YB36]|uniref:hypothetical protein n=1 Tax=Microbacterium sp. zg-YB36 TaxID=2969407 RepID=UPI00214CD364|nr:hypothetical protein [Microbacterium sp. zg-YB36]MDL5350487.1 hypothetical protein [Microbacterium sp. zg-YB36]
MSERAESFAVNASNVALAGALFFEFPFLRPLLQESLDDNDGEVLAHLLFPDVVRWMMSPEASQAQALAVWQWLETIYPRTDTAQQEVIVFSAIEMIPPPGEPGSHMRGMLGPKLRKEDPWLNPRFRP